MAAELLAEDEKDDEAAAAAKRPLNRLLQRLPHLLVQSDESATTSESRASQRPPDQNGSGALSVIGVGVGPDNANAELSTPASKEAPHSPLTPAQTRRMRHALAAWQVVEEVLALVAAMERDLKLNAHLLDEERERIELMNGRLEQLAEMRLNELPEAVQRGATANSSHIAHNLRSVRLEEHAVHMHEYIQYTVLMCARRARVLHPRLD